MSEKLTAPLEALPADRRNWSIFRQPDGPAGTGRIESIGMAKGSDIAFLTGYMRNLDLAFEAWSVRIRMPRGGGAVGGGTHGFIIRERSISSRPIGEQERKVMAQWEHDGMPSMGRAEHFKKLEEAQAIDKARRDATAGQPQPD